MESRRHLAPLRAFVKSDGRIIAVGVVFAFVILTLDFFVPLGVAAGVPYVVLVLLCLWAKNSACSYLMATVGTVFTIVGYSFSPEGGVHWVVLTNRGLAIFAIWAVALFRIKRFQEVNRREAAEAKRQAAERGLSDSEAQLRLIMDSVPVGIAYIDPDKRLQFVSKGYETLYGLDAKNIIGKTLRSLIGEPAYDRANPYIYRALAGEKTRHENTITVDGREISLVVNHVPDKQPNGKVTGLFSLVQDVSERKKAAAVISKLNEDLENRVELLTERQAELAEVERLAHVGSWEWDIATNRVEWSDECCKIFGVESGIFDATFENIAALIPSADAGIIAAATRRAVETGESYELEHRVIRPDGSVRHVMERGEVSVWDENGQPKRVRGSMHDITEQKETEEQLRQAQKMEAVGQLTGGIAHEFNNLLMVIFGNLEALDSQLAKDDPLHSFTAPAMKGALRGAELTQSLLAFSRKQTLERGQVDLNGLVLGMQNLFQRTLAETITIETDLAEGLWHTSADAGQIESALLNFVLNARDAMPDGGTITVRTSNRIMTADPAADPDGVGPGDYVTLQVSDSGAGMTDEQIEHAFEPFYTTKDVGEGTGLGLSVAFGFAKQSGGCLEIESEPGQGTTVRLSLPRAAEAEVGAEREQGTSTKAVTGSGKILVVEDDGDVRQLVCRQLTILGYEIIEAQDGRAALALFEEHPDIDLLFSDVVLPGGISGPEAAKEARLKRPNLKVLFTSGYPEKDVETLDVGGKAAAILRKPYSRFELAEAIATVMNSD